MCRVIDVGSVHDVLGRHALVIRRLEGAVSAAERPTAPVRRR